MRPITNSMREITPPHHSSRTNLMANPYPEDVAIESPPAMLWNVLTRLATEPLPMWKHLFKKLLEFFAHHTVFVML